MTPKTTQVSKSETQTSFIFFFHSFSNSFPLWVIIEYEQSSLCYTVGCCWLFILNIVVCTRQTPFLTILLFFSQTTENSVVLNPEYPSSTPISTLLLCRYLRPGHYVSHLCYHSNYFVADLLPYTLIPSH